MWEALIIILIVIVAIVVLARLNVWMIENRNRLR